jgi:hypothetical protein
LDIRLADERTNIIETAAPSSKENEAGASTVPKTSRPSRAGKFAAGIR